MASNGQLQGRVRAIHFFEAENGKLESALSQNRRLVRKRVHETGELKMGLDALKEVNLDIERLRHLKTSNTTRGRADRAEIVLHLTNGKQ